MRPVRTTRTRPLRSRPSSVRAVLVLCLALVSVQGCKNTEQYLSDLHTATDPKTHDRNITVYDADLLMHEAMVGLMSQDILTVSQMGRAVHHCGRIIEHNGVALLRADAVALLTHIALRYPIPALTEPFATDQRVDTVATDALNALDAALAPLETQQRIEGLSNPDKVVAEENWIQLRKLTGQRLPLDVPAWESWWEANRDRFLSEAQEAGRDPLRKLAYLRYGSLASSRAILGYLATRAALHELPALRADMEVAQVRLARLVVEYGIVAALADDDPLVRAEAARSARRVLAPQFGRALARAYAREVHPDSKVQILKSLAWYPSRTTVELCLIALTDIERPVALASRDVMTTLVGKDLGPEHAAWRVWWEREGKTRWP